MFYLSVGINVTLIILLFLFIIKSRGSGMNKKIESIEREVKELNAIFTLPYIRGEAGETLLKELIKNALPSNSYKFQYGFKNGSRVDAIIKTGKYIVPIDSKFPIQSVKQLLLTDRPISAQIIKTFYKHGEDIAKKYIQPDEGTLNFAVMYIPSEKLYYKAFIAEESDLTKKLLKIGILVCSPSTLFSLIQTVVYGLKGFTLNEKHRETIEKIEALRVNYSFIQKQFSITSGHMKNLKQSINLCEKLLEDGVELIPE
jgi:DNA recombination protein RmuC